MKNVFFIYLFHMPFLCVFVVPIVNLYQSRDLQLHSDLVTQHLFSVVKVKGNFQGMMEVSRRERERESGLLT